MKNVSMNWELHYIVCVAYPGGPSLQRRAFFDKVSFVQGDTAYVPPLKF